jgi:hypothetical protein
VDRLIESVRPLATAEDGRLQLDAFKLPHHGSKYNFCSELLDLVSCHRYLVSTNGSYFDHPDAAAIARVIKYGGDHPEMIFNYRSDEALLWNNPRWQRRFGYRTSYRVGLEYTIRAVICVFSNSRRCQAAIWYSCVSPPRICFRRIG